MELRVVDRSLLLGLLKYIEQILSLNVPLGELFFAVRFKEMLGYSVGIRVNLGDTAAEVTDEGGISKDVQSEERILIRRFFPLANFLV